MGLFFFLVPRWPVVKEGHQQTPFVPFSLNPITAEATAPVYHHQHNVAAAHQHNVAAAAAAANNASFRRGQQFIERLRGAQGRPSSSSSHAAVQLPTNLEVNRLFMKSMSQITRAFTQEKGKEDLTGEILNQQLAALDKVMRTFSFMLFSPNPSMDNYRAWFFRPEEPSTTTTDSPTSVRHLAGAFLNTAHKHLPKLRIHFNAKSQCVECRGKGCQWKA